MPNKLFITITTLLCTASGFAAGWFLAKNKFETLADNEVESVKKHLKEFYEGKEEVDNKDAKSTNNTTVKIETPKEPKQDKKVDNYTDYGKQYRSPEADNRVINKDGERTNLGNNKPYIITLKEFEQSTNKVVTLWYTDDKVLCDDDGNELKPHEYFDMIGTPDILDNFGEDCDSLYIRNDVQDIDFEILIDHRIYYKTRPTNRFTVPEEGE